MAGAPKADETMMDIEKMLIRHEGLRLKPYRCTSGKLTIGVGRNLDDVGITEGEARKMLRDDITRCTIKLMHDPLWGFSDYNAARQNVLVNMCFQLGKSGLDKFKKLRAAMNDGDWDRAAEEMLSSKWARQTPNRANELAKIMRTGEHVEP